MKVGILLVIAAMALGIVIGAVGASLYWIGRDAGLAAPASAKPPIHPIVGTWQTKLQFIGATYRFANDGTFVLTFTNLPKSHPTSPTTQEAGGTWRVEGKELVLTNTWSNTPMTIVGEVERATIIAVDASHLELEHADRKGQPERLTFGRARPDAVSQ